MMASANLSSGLRNIECPFCVRSQTGRRLQNTTSEERKENASETHDMEFVANRMGLSQLSHGRRPTERCQDGQVDHGF